ncbi:hypothetical protein [Nocardioides limicola]|uniref:hypothetical protein n=1 Tax=Nocardioides limicola TaxID=2803368 RepID=UPI00193BAE81|nr:hypothetical protein [Nocardioides sp. DJM-14]
MKTPESARTLAEDLLARAAEDWVSAAEVIDLARRSGLHDPELLRDLSIGLIGRLIFQGLLVPGDYDGTSHSPWDSSPAQAMARITEDWCARTDPFVMPGEIVWLDTTDAGQRLGQDVWRRES